MNTYTKILITTLPLFFITLLVTTGTAYYFSRNALTELAVTWLDTRLDEAMELAAEQDNILREYDLAHIPASIAKAKMDAGDAMSAINVGQLGHIFAVDTNGRITIHPDKAYIGLNIKSQNWFQQLNKKRGQLSYENFNVKSLAMYDYFAPWNIYILATDPEQEVYGAANQIKSYVIYLGIYCSVIVALALMILSNKLTQPLRQLTDRAEKIGKGDLNTRITIRSSDEFGRLATVFNQMTEQLKQTLNSLKHKEEHFRSLIENASDIITIIDTNGTIIYGSPSIKRALGYQVEELLGKNSFDFIHPEDREASFSIFSDRINSVSSNPPSEFRFRHKDGSWKTIEATSQNLIDHPSIKGLVVNCRDITLRKQAQAALERSHQDLEQRVIERTRELNDLNKELINEVNIRKQKEVELEKANQAKSEFLANISHEIRTPLNSVIGFSELLTTMVSDPQQEKYLNAIKIAGNGLLTLINDILDLSKTDAGKMELHYAPINIYAIFNEVRRLFKVKANEKGLEYQEDIDPDIPPSLLLDDVRLRQVLVNVVGNAVKFTHQGYVKIIARTSDCQTKEKHLNLSIDIEDSGIGILMDKTETIFESFMQESAGTARKFGGTGLGLSISKKLMELMGGQISVFNNENTGSTFHLTLPEIEISSIEPEVKESVQIDLSQALFSKEKILIVDDEPAIRFMIRAGLEKANLTVIEAENGEQAISMAQEEQPDLILMDISMPVMDGLTAISNLKIIETTKDIPIIILTASVALTNPKAALDGGFVSCLTKPINIHELYVKIAQYLPGYENKSYDPIESNFQTDIRNVYTEYFIQKPDFKDQIVMKILPGLKELQEGMTIGEVNSFANDLEFLGSQFQFPIFIEFGRQLRAFAESFDIENINNSMQRLIRDLETALSEDTPPVHPISNS